MKKETKQISLKETIKLFWYFLEQDKKKFVFYFIILLSIFFYDFVPTYMMGKLVDFFSNYSQGQSISLLYFYSIFVGVTWILSSLIRLYSKRALNVIGQRARMRARTWGFERLTEFSLEWHNKENTGNKLQRIFTGADSINGFMKVLRKDLLKIIANVSGVIAVFIFTDLKFVILVVLYSTIFLVVEFAMSKRVFALSNEFNKLNQSAGGVYMESASNMLSIKALGGASGAIAKVSSREFLSQQLGIEKAYANNLKWRLLQVINGIALGIFILMLGFSVVNNSISLGMVLVLFTYFFNKLQTSLGDVSELHTDIIDFRSDFSQMVPIFKETEFIKTGNESFPKDWQEIEIKNAVMNYGSEQMGLKDFNLILKRNTKTGIAGLSGSGKSTLAKIILGLYSLKSGEFKIGKKDYYSIAHNETLGNTTVVLQETELFNLSLRDNITMMREEDNKLLNMAIDIAQLKEVIDRLPEGLNATIGEKGYMLSGGERQRLGIARAIYKNAPIIILDEATSSLDSETESKIMEKLLGAYGKDKTFLIIAHRLGTLKYTDNIAVMERGKVAEEGSYDVLMKNKDSVFFRLNQNKNKKVTLKKEQKSSKIA